MTLIGGVEPRVPLGGPSEKEFIANYGCGDADETVFAKDFLRIALRSPTRTRLHGVCRRSGLIGPVTAPQFCMICMNYTHGITLG